MWAEVKGHRALFPNDIPSGAFQWTSEFCEKLQAMKQLLNTCANCVSDTRPTGKNFQYSAILPSMKVSKTNIVEYCFGQDVDRTAIAALLSVAVFSAVYISSLFDTDIVPLLVNTTQGGVVVLLLLAAAYYYHENRGVLVVFLIVFAPIYAVFIRLVELGNIAPSPLREAVLEAVPLTLLFAVPITILSIGVALVYERFSTN